MTSCALCICVKHSLATELKTNSKMFIQIQKIRCNVTASVFIVYACGMRSLFTTETLYTIYFSNYTFTRRRMQSMKIATGQVLSVAHVVPSSRIIKNKIDEIDKTESETHQLYYIDAER